MDSRAGGVALLSSQSVHAQFTCEINVTGIESVWCMFITNTDCANNPIYIGTVYRSPTCSFDNLKLWCESVHNYFFTNSQLPKLIILGDFNLPHFDWTIPCITCNELSHSFLLSFLHEHSLSQLNLTPTRNSNILDLVLTNIPDRITNLSVNPPFSTSDHDSLSLSLGTYLQQSNTDRQNILDSGFDYKRADFLSIKLALQSINWQDLLASDNINNIWQIFCHTLLDIVSMHCPRKQHLNRNSNNRLPHNILNLIRSKHRAWRHYKANVSEVAHSAYRNLANITRNAIRLFYRNRELNVLQSRNTRSFYSYVNSRLNPPPSFPQLCDPDSPDNLLVDNSRVANVFNEYFGSVFSHDDNIPPVPFNPPAHNEMPTVSFDTVKIKSLIRSIKSSSPGPDNIHPILLKNLADELATPLSIIFNKSYNTATLPSDWLISHVHPIYKGSGSRFSPDNYRPVSLTSVVCKLMESIIKDAILQHMLTQHLFTPYQHGFLPKRSTLSALLSTHFDWINSIKSHTHTHCVFFDLSKAFDSICHRKLLYKLSLYSLHPVCLAWIKAFLSDRLQRVKIKSCLSNPITCSSGTPQGSVLSSTLFTIYINDLPFVIHHSNICLFADDVKLYKSIATQADIENIQSDINCLSA